jgi:hypothetical protein
MACLPTPLQGWVVDATVHGLDRLEEQLTFAPLQEREHLHTTKRAIEAQLTECSDGQEDAT